MDINSILQGALDDKNLKKLLAIPNQVVHKFVAEAGTFTIWAGSSSRDLPLSAKINYLK